MIRFHNGYRIQKGFGIGSFFASLFRRVLPIAKSALKSSTGQAVKNIALDSAKQVALDALSGKSIVDSAKSNFSSGLKKIGKEVTPLTKSAGKAVLESAHKMVSDVISGKKDIKNAALESLSASKRKIEKVIKEKLNEPPDKKIKTVPRKQVAFKPGRINLLK